MRRIAPLVLVSVVLLAGCGRGEKVEESKIIGDTLTVYSSLPLSGPLEPVARDVIRAEKLAIEEAGGRSGDYKISFVSLDSADPETGQWTPRLVANNAREAVEDLQTIAYLGELEAGASAISLPILNEGGMLQISPGDTYAGLTQKRGAGEPEKYYPSGKRTFARMVPSDSEQARRLATLILAGGARRVAIADDRHVASTALADAVEKRLEAEDVEIVRRDRLYAKGDLPEDLGRDVREDRADAFLYTGAYNEFAVGVLRQLAEDAPAIRLYGSDALAVAPELPAKAGRAADRLLLTAVRPDTTAATPAFARSFKARYGVAPDRRAVLGYEAMRVVLRAIEAAGASASSRPAVIREALRIATAPPSEFAAYRIEDGVLVSAPSAL